MRTLLFHRKVGSYTGGHGKVLDYVHHVTSHPAWLPQVYVTPGSIDAPDNPFATLPCRVPGWHPAQADALFLGGADWLALTSASKRPVINLVQHVRHADPHYGLRPFLSRRAIRICVSQAVAQGLAATGEVHGPVVVIPAAVDVHALAKLGQQTIPHTAVFIDAVKQPMLGEEVAGRLRAQGLLVHLHLARCARSDYLALLASARIVVTLPDPVEGFYLPGLEAMAMGRTLVQYDCAGSRDYLRHGYNAQVPDRDASAIAQTVLTLIDDPHACVALAHTATRDAMAFDLDTERKRFHAMLDDIDALWEASA